MPAKLALGLSATLAALSLASCGGSSSSSTSASSSASSTTSGSVSSTTSAASAAPGGASHLSIAADPGGTLKYDKSALHAGAGKVTIAFANQSPVPHNLTISGPGGQVVSATPTFQGGTKTVSATLKPGTYTFYCTVPGHRQAGMQGTLTVS